MLATGCVSIFAGGFCIFFPPDWEDLGGDAEDLRDKDQEKKVTHFVAPWWPQFISCHEESMWVILPTNAR